MARNSRAGTPRRLICVRGEESRLPGSGETVTAPPSTAEVSSAAGVHVGAELEELAPALAVVVPAARPEAKQRQAPRKIVNGTAGLAPLIDFFRTCLTIVIPVRKK
jgi:hypothetical protein